MNDRLDELKNNASSRQTAEEVDEEEDFDLEAANGTSKSRRINVNVPVLKSKQVRRKTTTKSVVVLPKEELDCFFRDIATVGSCIEVIKEATKCLTIEHQGDKSLTSYEFDSLITKTNKQAMKAKKLLEKIREESDKVRENGGANSATLR